MLRWKSQKGSLTPDLDLKYVHFLGFVSLFLLLLILMKLQRKHLMNIWHLSFLFVRHTVNHLKIIIQSQGLCVGWYPHQFVGFPPLGCVCPHQFRGRICSPTIICSHQICLVNLTTLHLASYCHLGGRGVAPVGYVIDIITCVTYRKWPGASQRSWSSQIRLKSPCQPPFFSECGTYHLTCYNPGATCIAQVHPLLPSTCQLAWNYHAKWKSLVFFSYFLTLMHNYKKITVICVYIYL